MELPVTPLAYDAVIATRNRPEALALSIPLLIGQSRSPAQLIVIDSSDDHAATAAAVAAATRGWPGRVIVERSAPGLPHQRNCGLARVTAPVVLFPDDDSLLCPGTAEALLAVYERDAEGVIAAVCAADAPTPPAGVLEGAAYRMSGRHRRQALLRPFRHRVERQLTVLKPALYLGRVLNGRHRIPAWLAGMDAVPVEYMTGYRMSFRTDAIRPSGFDEALGGYALDEDIDASFTAMRAGLVVGALRARIYHHRCPSGRAGAFDLGRMTVLNRAYVLLKHAAGPIGSAALTNAVWRRHLGFVAVKLSVSALAAVRRPGARARLAGIWAGHRQALRLWRAPARDRAAACVGQPA